MATHIKQQLAARTGHNSAQDDVYTSVERMFVRDYLERKSIGVRFDGGLFREGQDDWKPLGRSDLRYAIARRSLDHERLLQDLIATGKQIGLKKGDLRDAFRVVFDHMKWHRRADLLAPLFSGDELSNIERKKAESQWKRLAEASFEMPVCLSVAVMKHFVWQVGRKAAREAVTDHLMPVFFSPNHGSGKTTAVQRFCQPVKELCYPGSADEISDPRSSQIFSYPVIDVDDMGRVLPDKVANLKRIITGGSLGRRKLFSSLAVKTEQRTTLIGTSNLPLSELINDPTGNRRFCEMPFGNANPGRGGSQRVQDIINGTDYGLLWRSVDIMDASPIGAAMSELVKHQEKSHAIDPLEEWLRGLNVATLPVEAISHGRRGVNATKLHRIHQETTKQRVAINLWSAQMAAFAGKPGLPFAERVKLEKGSFFPLA